MLSKFVFFLGLLLPVATFALASSSPLMSIVTGANGYVGRAIVHELLQQPAGHGDAILCLVRSHRVEEENVYWQSVLSKQQQPLSSIQVLPYDMLDGGASLCLSLDQCRDSSCVNLYHVASVFGPTENHKETALQNVQGTRNVMETLHRWRREQPNDEDATLPACKVILTSSMAAVRGTGQAPRNGKYYTADDWNSASVLGANWGASYQWSKMESEKQARKLADDYDIPLVVMCPSFVFGPPHGESSSFSIQLVRQWAKGESPVQSRLLVDIRDVAVAHVRAGRNGNLRNGRFLLSTDARVSSRELADWIRAVTAPEYQEKIHSDDEFTGGAIPIGEKEVDAETSLRETFGLTLRTTKETIQDMTARLLNEEVTTE